MIHKPTELIKDPNVALQMLKAGNERYLKDELAEKRNYQEARTALANEQKPFAVILTCSDSRVPPEIFFDQKLGNIFTIRNAGNIADKTALGSIEYAVNYLKTRLIVVCGHSKCGAVIAAHSGEEFPPNINHIVEHIKPAVEIGGNIDEIVLNNVKRMVKQIMQDEVVHGLEVLVVGACYDIYTGEVHWL
ncbi:MAG: carbonic anhydrase [Treponema sp.]|jgi:carbonic anhydrase|nr:carbonic anhydrase [Treponema sp.]